ncbi:hypothetical protein Cni_G26531 [Canna indica]|uniref:Uncharacterized protein n=1 Tax=Canna indica TaxID=4628 RepID=A0AAQ3L387_9LILI|nr:hypothetical protein Cni_G26531 [Canna indica]
MSSSMEETGKAVLKRRCSDGSPSITSQSATGSEGSALSSKKIKSFQECARERLKQHRMEMAGRVCIPDTWGQESFLKDWVDRRVFESFSPERLASARSALVEDCRRGNAGCRVEIDNRC